MKIKLFVIILGAVITVSGCASKRENQDGMPAKTKQVGERKLNVLDVIGAIFTGAVEDAKDKQDRKPHKIPKGGNVPSKFPSE